ncbi:MAG: lysophospholipid acyltransferase family protein [Bacteroidales bacterium]
MRSNLLYGLLYGWAKALALLPFPLLYLLSDFLYVAIYKVGRYRLRTVRSNMKASFPEKTEADLRQTERAFYRHFADYLLESIKMAHVSLKEIQRRAYLTNPALIDRLMNAGHPCILMLMGHYGNWEWFSAAATFFEDAHIYLIYRPLNNKAIDRLFVRLRTRFGSSGIRKNDTARNIIRLKQNHTRSAVIFIADQTPSTANLHYWTTFLNQETAILTGPERIARKQKLPVVFIDVRKTARGYYTAEFKLITQTPEKTPPCWITEQYARLMEKSILRNPACWLWTHKRWKHKREDAL